MRQDSGLLAHPAGQQLQSLQAIAVCRLNGDSGESVTGLDLGYTAYAEDGDDTTIAS